MSLAAEQSNAHRATGDRLCNRCSTIDAISAAPENPTALENLETRGPEGWNYAGSTVSSLKQVVDVAEVERGYTSQSKAQGTV